ncbi:hypothetical protein [Phenylobacterium sp.]|uniref:hypothetical protein n=1 Tax=Phenylobacterium sp. TaxID=1871053 RepID=UPI0035B12A23
MASPHQLARKADIQAWETELPSMPETRWCRLAMTPIDPAETAASLAAAEDLGAALVRNLRAMGHLADTRIQGSVAADTHIRDVSDVDLLVLSHKAMTADPFSLFKLLGGVGSDVTLAQAEKELGKLRRALDVMVTNLFGADRVVITGAKAVRVTAYGNERPIDVVAAGWYDSTSHDPDDPDASRGVRVFDRQVQATSLGWPFRQLNLIAARDAESAGGLRRAIRLCKHLAAEAAEEGEAPGLSSFQITGLLYALEPDALRIGAAPELAILAGAQAWLAHLVEEPAAVDALVAPEGGRRLLPVAKDLAALANLSKRLTRLAFAVASEVDPVGEGDLSLRLRRAKL